MDTNYEQVARDIFDIIDYINGSLSGGIEAPRRVLDVTADENAVSILYTYSPICGLSDCVYHDTRAGKNYTDTFEFSENKILLNGEENIFAKAAQGFEDTDYVKEAIDGFYAKYPVYA